MPIITSTQTPINKPPIIMMVYGMGGVGKTTFATTSPKPLFLDFENGTKYLGLRNINVDVAKVQKWEDLRTKELLEVVKSNKYETIVLDPIGEAMEKLINTIATHPITKYRQTDGSPTMAGWGYVKKTMRDFLKFLRDTDKNIILIAHIEEKEDENKLVKRPLIATKIREELINLVDIVAYMSSVQDNGEEKRILLIDPSNERYVAKDRSGQLGKIIQPNFELIIKTIHGSFKWNKEKSEKDKSYFDIAAKVEQEELNKETEKNLKNNLEKANAK